MSDLRESAARAAAATAAFRRFQNVFALSLLALLLGVGGAGASDGGPEAVSLDLNRATAAELEALPGIGGVKASAIIAARDARGGFASVDELESVRGIGPALVAKLRPLVRVGPRTAKAAGEASRRRGPKP